METKIKYFPYTKIDISCSQDKHLRQIDSASTHFGLTSNYRKLIFIIYGDFVQCTTQAMHTDFKERGCNFQWRPCSIYCKYCFDMGLISLAWVSFILSLNGLYCHKRQVKFPMYRFYKTKAFQWLLLFKKGHINPRYGIHSILSIMFPFMENRIVVILNSLNISCIKEIRQTFYFP